MAENVVSMFATEDPFTEFVSTVAEQELLGTLLADPGRLERIPAAFSPDHFHYGQHAEIYKAMVALSSSGVPSSFAVMNLLRNSGIEPEYMASLLSVKNAPAALVSLALTVTDLWRRRELSRISGDLARHARANAADRDPAWIAADIMSQLDSVVSATKQQETMFDIHQASEAAIEAAERTAKGISSGTFLGFRDLDQAIGSLDAGAVYVIAGRPGMGKTALALQSALSMSLAGRRVLYDSLEMQAAQIGRRAISLLAELPNRLIKGGNWTTDVAERIVAAQKQLYGVPLLIDQQAGVNTAVIGLKARAAARRLGGLDCIFVDHMHIVTPDDLSARQGPTHALEKISGDLKRLAVEMQCPVIALAQLNRGVESREDKRPTMADLRQSGAIEQDAEAIIMLYRGEYYLPKTPPEPEPRNTATRNQELLDNYYAAQAQLHGKAEAIIAKLRDDEPCTIPMLFNGAYTRFGDVTL